MASAGRGYVVKALTLHQPWASLIALGVKSIETRSWSTSYRGPLAIHAGKKRPGDGEIGCYVYDDCRGGTGWIAEIYSRDGYTGEAISDWIGDHMPLGAVVATCTLVDVAPIATVANGIAHNRRRFLSVMGESLVFYDDGDQETVTDQRPYGDFSPGRYAWLLSQIEPLAEPVPAKGRQGLWEWTR